jgi:ABC-2 type transport system permease protein
LARPRRFTHHCSRCAPNLRRALPSLVRRHRARVVSLSVSTLGIGIFIASFSASQQQAMLGTFGFMLPAMLLSGFMSPISSMPSWLRPFTMLIPMRHYVEIMRGCLLKGTDVEYTNSNRERVVVVLSRVQLAEWRNRA